MGFSYHNWYEGSIKCPGYFRWYLNLILTSVWDFQKILSRISANFQQIEPSWVGYISFSICVSLSCSCVPPTLHVCLSHIIDCLFVCLCPIPECRAKGHRRPCSLFVSGCVLFLMEMSREVFELYYKATGGYAAYLWVGAYLYYNFPMSVRLSVCLYKPYLLLHFSIDFKTKHLFGTPMALRMF